MESEKEVKQCSVSQIVCEVCHGHFKTKRRLKQHVQTSHQGLRYSCNMCEYQATREGHLKTHIQSVHEKIKYSCNLCDHQASS